MRIILCFLFWLIPQMAFAVSSSVDHATVTVYYTESASAVPDIPVWGVAILFGIALSLFLLRRYTFLT